MLFTSWQHHGNHQGEAGNLALCTMAPDGTGFGLFCRNSSPMSLTKSYAQQLTGRLDSFRWSRLPGRNPHCIEG